MKGPQVQLDFWDRSPIIVQAFRTIRSRGNGAFIYYRKRVSPPNRRKIESSQGSQPNRHMFSETAQKEDDMASGIGELFSSLKVLDQKKAAAYFLLLFSLAYGIRVVVLVPSLPEQALFYSLGIVALSIGRLLGVVNPVPFPELLVILADTIRIKVLAFQRIPAADEFLLAFDRNFGFAGMFVGKVFYSFPIVSAFFRTLYFGEMLAVPLLYTILPVGCRKRYGAAIILLGAIIPFMYRVCPGAGPLYLLPGFPYEAPGSAFPHLKQIDAPLNTTPSGHFGWALMMFWFANKYATKPVRIAAGLYAVVMAIATLGTGEHYIIDLVLSVPFTACIWALVHKQWKFAATAVIAVVVWCVALQGGLALLLPPLVAWISVGATVAVFGLYEYEELTRSASHRKRILDAARCSEACRTESARFIDGDAERLRASIGPPGHESQ